MASVTLDGIKKDYGAAHPVLHGIDLAIEDGELVVFVGPSGCGKSTLLRMIAGLENISGGTLHIGGTLSNDVAPAARKLAMVFQSYALYPHMTVFENMAFALKLGGQSKADVEDAVQRAADILQITPLLARRPKELSGGQRQRVAIGRAIVRKPGVFLFDEPLSNLDASLRVQMRVEISRLHRQLGSTMIYVTHDQVEAMTLGQRIVVINGGRIEQVGTPHELYTRPSNLFVAGFLGSPKMNLMPGTVAQAGSVQLAGGALLAIDTGSAQAGDAVTFGVRAEHLAVDAHGAIDAEVRHIEYLGDQNIIYTSELHAARMGADANAPLAGSRIRLAPALSQCHLFDAAGRSLHAHK